MVILWPFQYRLAYTWVLDISGICENFAIGIYIYN